MIHINHFTSHFLLYLVKLDSTIKDTDTDKSYLFKSKLIVPNIYDKIYAKIYLFFETKIYPLFLFQKITYIYIYLYNFTLGVHLIYKNADNCGKKKHFSSVVSL